MIETQPGTLQSIARHLVLAMQPLKEAVADLSAFRTFLYRLGWDVKSLPSEYTALAAKVDAALTALNDLDDHPQPEQIYVVLSKIKELYQALKNINTAPEGVDTTEFFSEFGQRLFELLLVDYLVESLPSVYSVLLGLDIITQEIVEETENRPGFLLNRFKWGEIPKVFTDPASIATRVYGWNTDDLDFHRLAGHLLEFFVALNWPAYIQRVDDELGRGFHDIPEAFPPPTEWELKIPLLLDNIGGQEVEVGLALLELPAEEGKPSGLIFQPLLPSVIGTSYNITDDLRFELRAGSDISTTFGVLLRPNEITIRYPFQPGATFPEAGFGATLEYAPLDKVLLLGSIDVTRLEFQGAQLGLQINEVAGDLEIIADAELRGLSLIVPGSDGDSFVDRLLGDRDLKVDIPLGVEWSSVSGIHFRGSGGFEVDLPSHLELGIITINGIRVQVKVPLEGDSRIENSVGVNFVGHLGPLSATVENLGVMLTMTFIDGNAGPFDIDLGFKGPDGVGLSIDGGGFSGGGFLKRIQSEGRYEGMLELEYEDKISLKAIGLITTRLPGGKSGFSLLIIITAEFTPIQLGLGFTLNGVGGMLGYNRTADVERLRSGLRDNSLSSVLFPQNIVENASRILSDLNQLFPVQPGRFLFGPMARIGWGSPTRITIDLGLLIEIPDPVRILILGVVRAVLPDEEAKLLHLQVNFLGVIDFEAERFSFDASLYDSKLLGFTLSGDMAVRMSWGDDSNFLLSVGGFHPSYEPPPLNLPMLRRLTLQLTSGDNPRLTLETYFAITSNTVQFGAKVELLAMGGSFSVYGLLSFDVLFQFNPFYFIASISAILSLRAGGSEIASISLDFTLEGPTPWRARGTASLKICWFLTVKVSFDKTFGEVREILLPDVPVLPLLQAALSDAGNWEAQPVGGHHSLVTFKKVEQSNGHVVAAPFGVLTIQQKIVPLDIEIQLFGSQRPADGNRFSIEQVTVVQSNQEDGPPEMLGKSSVDEQFAPAQFFEMKDAQKLSSKSFERYPSGIKLLDSELLDLEYGVARKVDYELFYVDEQRALVQTGETVEPDILAFQTWSLHGAIANSPLSQARNGKSALAPSPVHVSQEAFAVVRKSDLRLAEAGAQASSEAGAQRMLRNLVGDNPTRENELVVVPLFEVNQS